MLESPPEPDLNHATVHWRLFAFLLPSSLHDRRCSPRDQRAGGERRRNKLSWARRRSPPEAAWCPLPQWAGPHAPPAVRRCVSPAPTSSRAVLSSHPASPQPYPARRHHRHARRRCPPLLGSSSRSRPDQPSRPPAPHSGPRPRRR